MYTTLVNHADERDNSFERDTIDIYTCPDYIFQITL